MSRDIKFRAWDKVAKKFLFPWPNGFNILGETTCFDLIGQQLGERNPEMTTLEKLNDIELMQFTGLRDKNGVEIYEGDILDTIPGQHHYFPNRVVVEYHAMAFMFVGKTKNASPHTKYTLDTITNKNITQETALEIIGNIYQNPELLNKEANNG